MSRANITFSRAAVARSGRTHVGLIVVRTACRVSTVLRGMCFPELVHDPSSEPPGRQAHYSL